MGINWQGNRGYAGDFHRSMPLVHFAPLARVPGVRLFSVQKYAGAEQLNRAWRYTLDSKREKLLPLVRTLNAVSPLATLERGYAIVSVEGGEILRNAAHAKPGTIVEARLAQGRIRAKVEGTS